jgi:HK97 family phage major capsid protein
MKRNTIASAVAARVRNAAAGTIDELNTQLVAIKDRAKGIQDAADTEGRELTPAEAATIDAALTEFESVAAEIKRRNFVAGNLPAMRRGDENGEITDAATAAAQRPSAEHPQARTLGRTPRAASSGWRDKDGRPVACLSLSESVASALGYANDPNVPRVGEAIRAIATGRWDRVDIKNALSEGSDTGGGYFVTPALGAQIIDLLRPRSVVFRAGAQTIPMPTSELDLVKVQADPTVTWTGENASIETSQPVFGRLRFVARKVACIVPVSQELLEDAANAASEIERLLSIAVAQELDRVAMLGDGTGGEPTGILYTPGISTVTTSGSPTPTLDYDLLLQALQAIEDANGDANGYALNPRNKRILDALKDLYGAYLQPPVSLRDLPRYTSTKLPNDTAFFGDFRQVMVGMRVGAQIQTSPYAGTAFEKDQVLIRVRMRCDVQLAHPAALCAITDLG